MTNEEQDRHKPSLLSFEFLLAACLAITIYMAAPYLLAVLMGAILAVLMNPVYRWFRKRKLGAKTSSLIVILLMLIVIVGPLTLLSVNAAKQGISLGQKVISNENYSPSSIARRLGTWGLISSFIDDPASFEVQVRATMENIGKSLSALILVQAGAIPELLLQIALTLLTCFFLLLDGTTFADWITDKIPLDKDLQKALKNSFQNTSVSVIRATFAAAGSQTIVIALGFLIAGVPGVALASGATFILSWIPLVGCSPVWITAAFYLFINGSFPKAIFMCGVGLVAGIVDNIVRPAVLKGKADMHPLVSLIAVFGGIHLFGLIGVFIGPILAAVLILLLKTWPAVAERSGLELHPKKNNGGPP